MATGASRRMQWVSLRHRHALSIVGFLAVFLLMTSPFACASNGEEFFESHVRPLFEAHCIECHGVKKQEASLRLDSAEAFAKGSDGGPVFDVAQPPSSKLLVALEYAGDVQMPPDGKLSDEQIATVRQWLAMGAPWPKGDAALNELSMEERAKNHWAFQPVRRPSLPHVADNVSSAGPVDHFLFAQLSERGLAFAPRTNRATLLRRATYDLLGLPPSWEEVRKFQSDEHPDAYERQIDRLLASPHYGEKWGRHWLDVARYAETKGYVFTAERRYPFAFTYRDWVIRSFNEDLPYNRFVLDQIAADKIETGEDKRPLAAMGFLTVGRRFLNNNADIIDDRIDVVFRGMQGLTVSCARCHDHKYDPIPTADYYSLYGVFASSTEPGELPVIADASTVSQREDYARQLADRQAKIDEYIQQKARDREAQLKEKLAPLILAAEELGANADKTRLKEKAGEIGVGERTLGLFVSKWQPFLSARLSPQHPVFGLWAMFVALPSNEIPTKGSAILEKLKADGASAMGVHPAVARMFDVAPPENMRDVVERYAKAFSAARTDDLGKVLDEPGSPLKVTAEEALASFDQGERNGLQDIKNKVVELKTAHPGAPLQAMVLQDGELQNPHIFIRGNPGRPGDAVPRQFLAILEGDHRQPFQDGSGRRELAERIASENNPLTARVMANRIWHWHFSRGLVRATSDFGMRTEPPSHPELLDWLAAEFVDRGWSIKAMHREIMGSTAYRQASIDDAAAKEVDPDNDLLWSFRRRRLEFEELRDSLLAVTGELDDRLFGRSAELVGDAPTTRRAVYGFIDRQNLEPLFRTFDFANPNTSVPLRFVTTVPQQPLFLMNSSFVAHRAKALSDDPELLQQPSVEHRINALYQNILRRPAAVEEIDLARAFLESPEIVDKTTDTAPISAWEQLAHVLLMTNEFSFVD